MEQGPSLNISDLQSSDGREISINTRSRQKLEPIQQEITKKRRRNRNKRTNNAPNNTGQQLSEATDGDIESYLNERLSRLDPVHNEDPTRQLYPIVTDHTPIGIGSLERKHATPTHLDTPTDSRSTTPTHLNEESEDVKRRRRRRTRKRERSLTQSIELTTERGEDPLDSGRSQLLADTRTEPPATEVPISISRGFRAQPHEEVYPQEHGEQDSRNYRMCQPDDPIFLVDEEDIREGPMVKQGPGITMERVQEVLNKEEGEEEGVDYRQLSETGGFTRVVRKRGRGKGIEGVDGPSSAPWGDSNTAFIMMIHNSIKRLSMGAHGLLAGISLWSCAVSIVLLSDSHSVFLAHYNDFPIILHSLYLLLLFIIITTTLDRIDISRTNGTCIQRMSHSLSQIAIVLALILLVLAFLLTLCVAFIDERMHIFEDRPDIWPKVLTSVNTTLAPPTATPIITVNGLAYLAIEDGKDTRLSGWVGVDTVRAGFVLMSWLITVFISPTDRMEEYLYHLDQQEEGEEEVKGAKPIPLLLPNNQ